jgi:two-component system, NarL family, captular synthesis response regulator RcsB
MNPTTRIILADDHDCVRLGVRYLLESVPSLSVVGEASDVPSLADLIDRCACDVVISDIAMPDTDGFANATTILRRILRHPPHPRIVVLTMLCHPPTLSGLLQLGVSAIVDKRDMVDALTDAIEATVAGRRYLSPIVQSAFDEMDTFPHPRTGILSAREWEVLNFYLQGLSISDIAARLDRSSKTIGTQRRSAMRKLGLDSDMALIRYAQQIGLI